MDERGVPLSLVVTGANRHDVTQLEALMDGIVVIRPKVTFDSPQHLCLDNGYAGAPACAQVIARGYIPHIQGRGEERHKKRTVPGYKARRWVVEASHSWFNRFRKILVRYEKTDASYVALLHLACAIIACRKVGLIYG